jgi:4-amino-4-deoxy-L-arabinose transferase-like glycosyltransferase
MISAFHALTKGPAPRWIGPAVFVIALAAQGFGVRLAERTAHHQATRRVDGALYFIPAARSLWTSGVPLEHTGAFCTHHPPLFPLALAPTLAAGDALGLSETIASQFLNVLFGSLSAVGLYFWSRRLLPWPWAALAAFAFGAYPPFVWLCRDAYNEPLFTALLLWGLVALAAGRERGRASWVFGAMTLLALATLTRAVGILIPFVVAAAYWFTDRRNAVPAARCDTLRFARLLAPGLAVYILLLLPWTVVVSRHNGRFTPVTSSFAFSHVDGLVNVPGNAVSEKAKSYFAIRPRQHSEILAFHGAAISEQLGSYVTIWGRKVFDAWSATESGRGRKTLLILNLPILILAAPGAVLRRRRGEAFGPEALAAVAVLLYFWAMSVAVWSTLRYMVPVFWVPLAFSAAGLRELLILAAPPYSTLPSRLAQISHNGQNPHP